MIWGQQITKNHVQCLLIRWCVIAVQFINEALRSPNHKTCFSFALGCPEDFNFPIHFRPFSPVSTQPHQNCQTKLKSCGPPRAKLKHVLWLGDLKASLKNSIAIFIHNTSSKNQHRLNNMSKNVTFDPWDSDHCAGSFVASLIKKNLKIWWF